jgi:hypothetical protein
MDKGQDREMGRDRGRRKKDESGRFAKRAWDGRDTG